MGVRIFFEWTADRNNRGDKTGRGRVHYPWGAGHAGCSPNGSAPFLKPGNITRKNIAEGRMVWRHLGDKNEVAKCRHSAVNESILNGYQEAGGRSGHSCESYQGPGTCYAGRNCPGRKHTAGTVFYYHSSFVVPYWSTTPCFVGKLFQSTVPFKTG